MSRIIAVTAAVVIVLVGCSQGTGEAPPGSGDRMDSSGSKDRTRVAEDTSNLLAPRSNDEPVPGVVGMTLREAQRALQRSGYGCAVTAERSSDAPPSHVVAQDPEPGFEGFEAQLVHLTVSKPFPEAKLPPDCVDLREEFQTVPTAE